MILNLKGAFMKKILLILIGIGILVFALIQFVPFGHEHTNPATVSEPQWSSPEARALVKESCFQCHSNETNWTWYSNIAPASWLIQFDVNAGRSKFNLSDWNRNPGELDEMVGTIQGGEMPPIQYTLFHPSARLNAQQKQDLINALTSSIK
jgi:mono/diheme cytochrome c family protein